MVPPLVPILTMPCRHIRAHAEWGRRHHRAGGRPGRHAKEVESSSANRLVAHRVQRQPDGRLRTPARPPVCHRLAFGVPELHPLRPAREHCISPRLRYLAVAADEKRRRNCATRCCSTRRIGLPACAGTAVAGVELIRTAPCPIAAPRATAASPWCPGHDAREVAIVKRDARLHSWQECAPRRRRSRRFRPQSATARPSRGAFVAARVAVKDDAGGARAGRSSARSTSPSRWSCTSGSAAKAVGPIAAANVVAQHLQLKRHQMFRRRGCTMGLGSRWCRWNRHPQRVVKRQPHRFEGRGFSIISGSGVAHLRSQLWKLKIQIAQQQHRCRLAARRAARPARRCGRGRARRRSHRPR